LVVGGSSSVVRQTVRCTLATLTIVACTAAATVRGADPDLSLLQERVDRLDALL
jgi:hypothetical protein